MFIATTTKKAVCLYEGMLPRKKMEQFNAFLSVFYALSVKSCDLFRGGGNYEVRFCYRGNRACSSGKFKKKMVLLKVILINLVR